MSNCSVIVMSCDRYREAWEPFFVLLKKYWNGNLRPYYLVTENLQCDIPSVTTIRGGRMHGQIGY